MVFPYFDYLIKSLIGIPLVAQEVFWVPNEDVVDIPQVFCDDPPYVY